MAHSLLVPLCCGRRAQVALRHDHISCCSEHVAKVRLVRSPTKALVAPEIKVFTGA